jgi:iron(III) transport system permease protein
VTASLAPGAPRLPFDAGAPERTPEARHRPSLLDRDGTGVLAALVAAALAFGALPLLRLAAAALAPQGQWRLADALAVVNGRAGLRALLNTLETASLSALLALALGTAVALVLATTDLRGRRPLAFLFVLSLMAAPQVAALAYLTLLGPSSPILGLVGLAPEPGAAHPLRGAFGIVLVLGLHHAPLVAITVAAGLRRVPMAVIEAAQVEGASGWQITRRIVLPLLRPHLVAAGCLAFTAGVGNFGIPALLGMPVNYLTLPTLIYRRLSSYGPSIIADAATLSLVVAAVAGLGALAGALALRRPGARIETERPLSPFWTLGRARPLVEAALWALVGVTILLPLASLLAAALSPTYGAPLTIATLTLDNFVEVLARQQATVRGFCNSLLLAGGSALLLTLAAVPLAWALDRKTGRFRDALLWLFELPYALPGVVLAIACILIFLKPLPVVNVSLYATPWIILLAYLARFAPLALKAPLAVMSTVDRAQEEAAALDGASLRQRLRHVIAPALWPAALAGGFLAFLLAFNELTVSALLWSAGTETLGVALLSLEEAGLSAQAAALALATLAVVAAAMFWLDRLAPRLPEGTLPWRL